MHDENESPGTESTTVIDGQSSTPNGRNMQPSPAAPPASVAPSSGRGRFIGVSILTLAIGFAGGVMGFAVADRVAADSGSSTTSTSTEFQPSLQPNNDGASAAPVARGEAGVLNPRDIYKKVGPGVVHVSANVAMTGSSFFGLPQAQEGVATGSGFVIDDDGHIVTNAHVVENSSSVTVSFNDDKEFEAEVIGQDVSTDIAVLKVDASKDELKNALSPVPYGDSGAVQVGDPVVAIGNPFNLERTLTTGVVSALQRQIRAQNGFAIDDVIQTDAAINPGNSGGPLLNMRGELIGVTSQIQSKSGGNEGIGFAVPANTVKRIADQLINNGTVEHAWLGVIGSDVDADIAKLFNLPVKRGVLVAEAAKDSPAAKAGIEGGTRDVIIDGQSYRLGGSIITRVDDEKLHSMRDLADYINTRDPGEKVTIEFYRGDDRKTVRIQLGRRPDADTSLSAPSDSGR